MLPHTVIAHEAGIAALHYKHGLSHGLLSRLYDKVCIAVGAELVGLLQLVSTRDWREAADMLELFLREILFADFAALLAGNDQLHGPEERMITRLLVALRAVKPPLAAGSPDRCLSHHAAPQQPSTFKIKRRPT